MARRPGRWTGDHSSRLVDVADVLADDDLIDSISTAPPGGRRQSHYGTSVVHGASRSPGAAVLNSDPLIDLFGAWRDELSAAPMPAAPAVRRAAAAVAKGGPSRKHTLRPALAVAAAIAALLAGTATIGSKDAAPDSALWGITQVLWPSRVESVASVKSVQNAIDRATSELGAGRSREAQLILLRAAVDLGNVDEVDGRTGLQASVNELWVKAAPGLPPPTGSDPWQAPLLPSTSSVSAPQRPKAPSGTHTAARPNATTASALQLAGPPEAERPSAGSGADSPAGGPAAGGSTSAVAPSASSASSPATSPAILSGSPVTSAAVPSFTEPSLVTSAPMSSLPGPTTPVNETSIPTSAPLTLPPPVITDPPVTGEPTGMGTTAPAPAPLPPTVTDTTTPSQNPAETTITNQLTSDQLGTPAQ